MMLIYSESLQHFSKVIWRKIASLVPRLQDNLETVICCDESDVYNENRLSETFSAEDRLLEYTINGDLCTQDVQVESTTVNDIDDDIPTTSTDNINICIESRGVPTVTWQFCQRHPMPVIGRPGHPLAA
ncbi:uncharacterized protein LOC143207462 [Lasioglossum baleicum]|uniref:uncharacterized protein LOC143207462 n=1 Tax=Lasioglossum baleicum TaxID=434251 RepID=UPI003FCD0E57